MCIPVDMLWLVYLVTVQKQTHSQCRIQSTDLLPGTVCTVRALSRCVLARERCAKPKWKPWINDHRAKFQNILADKFLSGCKVLSVPFACVGSGDPVRVLRLYTTNTLDTLWSIYCWGICTTCRYQFYCVMLKPYALRLPTATCVWVWLWLSVTACCTVLCGALYTACVDASRTVFWDRSWRCLLESHGLQVILFANLGQDFSDT